MNMTNPGVALVTEASSGIGYVSESRNSLGLPGQLELSAPRLGATGTDSNEPVMSSTVK